MQEGLTVVDTVLIAAAILGPLLAGLVLFGLGDRLPTTGVAPVLVVVQWALGMALGSYAWASAMGKVKPIQLQGAPMNLLQLWLLGWVCVATTSVLAMAFWRVWRREPDPQAEKDKDLVRWGRDR